MREGRACALDRVGREPERGIEEEPVEIRPPSSLPVGGDEGHRHLLAKYFPEQPRYACDWLGAGREELQLAGARM